MQHKERSTDYSSNTRLGIRIDKDLHKKLKLISVQEDKSMTLLIEELIRDFVEKYEQS